VRLPYWDEFCLTIGDLNLAAADDYDVPNYILT